MVKVKICGLTRNCDARAAALLGADYLGAVVCLRSPRHVPVERLAEVFRGVSAKRVGVFADAPAELILGAVASAELEAVQLHGAESAEFIRELKAHLGAVELWVARQPELFTADCPAELLVADTPKDFQSNQRSCCDWSAARRLARERKILLAGGLDATNLAAAIREVRPYGVDLASGTERAPGIKDLDKLNEIFTIIKEYK